MVTNIHEPEGKILRVVFEKKKSPSCKSERLKIDRELNQEKLSQNKSDLNLEERIRYECQVYKKKAVEVARDTMKKKYAVLRAELDRTREVKHKKIMTIVNEVKTAHERQDKMTEKFLGDVESLVSRFKVELDKMQELFARILKKLPQVDIDVDVKPNVNKINRATVP
ncbi:hypothetical protein SFRURICE_014230 [Spodoptera frugiperda]|nr:hypothetical protein SFRURICE_014230 [Spodoptera frugiperda]